MALYTVLVWQWGWARDVNAFGRGFWGYYASTSILITLVAMSCAWQEGSGGGCILHVYLACDGLPLRLGQQREAEVSMI